MWTSHNIETLTFVYKTVQVFWVISYIGSRDLPKSRIVKDTYNLYDVVDRFENRTFIITVQNLSIMDWDTIELISFFSGKLCMNGNY